MPPTTPITPTADLPPGLRDLRVATLRDLALAGETDVARVFSRAFTGTWTRAMRELRGDRVFLRTGDIPAMWLRDSTAQVRPYLLAATDPEVGGALAGVLRAQVDYVLTDPYANAFNAAPNPAAPAPLVWERKYEVDSLAAPLQLAYGLWRATGTLDHVDDRFEAACDTVLSLWTREQDHERNSPYVFRRPFSWPWPWPWIRLPFWFRELPRGGRGRRVSVTGMTWSGFRPSDDACRYGYPVASNALAAVALHGLAELAGVAGSLGLAARAAALSTSITEGIREHGTAEGVYAYEVDGRGHSLLMDDANVPSLLSLPYLGWCDASDPHYLRTRDFVLGDANPYFYQGRAASGVGSPHTPGNHVWPLAIIMQGLTDTDPAGKLLAARLVAANDAGTGAVHESFDVDDPRRFTRAWFGWGDALFSELVLELTGRPTSPLFPTLR